MQRARWINSVQPVREESKSVWVGRHTCAHTHTHTHTHTHAHTHTQAQGVDISSG